MQVSVGIPTPTNTRHFPPHPTGATKRSAVFFFVGEQSCAQYLAVADPNSGGRIPGSPPPTAKLSAMPESLLCCAALGSSSTELHHAAAGSASAADLLRWEAGQAMLMDGNGSSQGSLASTAAGGDSSSTGADSRSTRTLSTCARLLGDPERQVKTVFLCSSEENK